VLPEAVQLGLDPELANPTAISTTAAIPLLAATRSQLAIADLRARVDPSQKLARASHFF
jgi:hypothetical protein